MTEATTKKSKRLSNIELQKNVEGIGEQVDKVTEAVNDLSAQAEERNAVLDNKLTEIMTVFSRTLNQSIEPMEQNLGKEREPSNFTVDESGDAVLIDQGVHDVDSPQFKEKVALLKFMEEPVTVHIHQTSEKDADQCFDIQVNGRGQVFVRGQTYIVRRKFIEGLARAKPVHYENESYSEIQQGRPVQAVRYPSRRGLRYPFTVTEDVNHNGAAWLEAVLAQP